MENFNISGKVFLAILVFVIAISGLVFGATIIGTSGSSQNAVPTYKDKVVAATVTSFTTHVSQGHQAQIQSRSGSSSSTPRVRYTRGYDLSTGQHYWGTETDYGSVIHVHNEYSVPSQPMGSGPFYGT